MDTTRINASKTRKRNHWRGEEGRRIDKPQPFDPQPLHLREPPPYRFIFPDRGNDGKEKGDSNNGDRDGDGDGDGDGKSLIIPMDELSLGVDNVCDTLGVIPTCGVELIRSMSSRKIHMLSGSISSHQSSQYNWGIRLGATDLFGAQTRSITNSIRSRIISLRSDEAEEDKIMVTSMTTAP